MSRDKRISLKITDLSLGSVIKIFSFLQNLLETGIDDLDYFEENLSKFSVLEQYFICEYASEYFSKPRIKEWLRIQIIENGMEDNVGRIIVENADTLVNAIDGMKRSYKRRAQNYKRNFFSFKELDSSYNEEPIYFKIPFFIKPIRVIDLPKTPTISIDTKNKFKKSIQNILESSFCESDIKDFINNSFQFGLNNKNVYFLDIEINTNSKLNLMALMYKVWYEYEMSYISEIKKYKKYYLDSLTEISNSIKSGKRFKNIITTDGFILPKYEISEEDKKGIILSDTRKKFYPDVKKINELKKAFEIPTVTKKDFAKVIYNSFPHIREDYFKKKSKNKTYALDEYIKYLSTKIRN